MNATSLPRKERRRLERREKKKQKHGQLSDGGHPLRLNRHWSVPHVALLLIAAALVATAVIASVRSITVPAASVTPAAGNRRSIVQVFLKGPQKQPEIREVAKSTADWWLGKINADETEMWVEPHQDLYVKNRGQFIKAVQLKAGDQLLQQDGVVVSCGGAVVRPVISDGDYADIYHRIHGEDASVPMGAPGMYLSKVTQTFKREVGELYQIFYGKSTLPLDLGPLTLSKEELKAMSRQVNEGEGGSVFVTGEHPYYVVNKGRFIPVKNLEDGDLFRGFDGNELAFHGKRLIIAKAGDSFTVHNFEVANQHTYFAGNESVLVHNLCSEAIERYTSIFLHFRATDSVDDALKKALRVAVYDHRISTSEASVLARSLLLREGRSHLFDLFNLPPGRQLNLAIPSAPDGRSFITYAFKNADGQVVYVGRGSGQGNPAQVLQGRISKGHDHFHDGMTAEVVDVQKSKLANQGAEEFFIQAYREIGSPLTNVDESLSFANMDRSIKSITKLDAFFEELFAR